VRVSSLLGGVLVTLVAMNVTIIPAAQASLRRCDQHRLYGSDIHYAKRATERALGAHVPDWRTFNACTNADSAWSWTNMKSEPQVDGSVMDAAAFCSRGTGPWKCDFGTSRSMLTPARFFSGERKVTMRVPFDLDVPSIVRLLQRAIEVSADIGVAPSCEGASPADAAELQKYRDSFAQAFRFSDLDPFGEISDDKHGIAVIADDHVLVFRKPIDASAPPEFVCWAEQITVT
jgi:hypothetical protein